jgi:hypothetical protein
MAGEERVQLGHAAMVGYFAMRKAVIAWGSVWLLLAACQQENPYDPKHEAARKAAAGPPKIIGVDPDKFDCLKFLPVDEVSKLAGGGEVIADSTGVPPAAGTPAPCTYIKPHKYSEEELKQQKIEEEKRVKRAASGRDTTIAEEIEAWGKNLDKVYGVMFDCRSTAQDQMTQWMRQLKGKEEAHAKDVQVGKSAVDHIGGQLLFIDDDTPCAVTITGPDEPSRLALGQLVQGRLVLENAPMTPRAVQ